MLQGRGRGQRFDIVFDVRRFQLADQPGRQAVAKRVAGGEDDDGLPCRKRGSCPFRHLGQRAVHIEQPGIGGVGAYEIERARRADDQAGAPDAVARALTQFAPAFIENADQCALTHTAFSRISFSVADASGASSTRQMKRPSKSQTNIVS